MRILKVHLDLSYAGPVRWKDLDGEQRDSHRREADEIIEHHAELLRAELNNAGLELKITRQEAT